MYQRQVSFGEAISRGFKNYCRFHGRASRSEFWWFMLFYYIVNIAASAIAVSLNFSEFSIIASNPDYMESPEFASSIISLYTIPSLVSLAFFLPVFGITFRRLHDTGHSGWWWLISFIPLVGAIVMLVFMLQSSQMSENKYGPVPNLAGNDLPPAYNG